MSSIVFSTMLLRRKPGAALGLAAVLLFGSLATSAQHAQAPANSSPAPAAKKSPRHRARPAQAPAPEDPPPPPAPQPEPPKWPVNDAPNKPSVSWDSSGLKIQANNASLHAILNEVSADTGAKVEGMAADERVFGIYGPGTARDVLSQLLHGSSYNVLMIGDQGAGTPRQIVLSTRRSGGNQPQTNAAMQPEQPDEDVQDQSEDSEQSGQQPQIINRPMPMIPQGPPGVPPGPQGVPRTPQQVLQELQQRQQQIQDQQQQQQQQQQPH